MSTTLTINYSGLCSGGEHVTFDVSVEGGAARSFTMEVSKLRENLTLDDLHATLPNLLRAHFRGKTGAQVRSEFQAGPITMVI